MLKTHKFFSSLLYRTVNFFKKISIVCYAEGRKFWIKNEKENQVTGFVNDDSSCLAFNLEEDNKGKMVTKKQCIEFVISHGCL